jgi:hypothetical protein
MTLSNDAFRAAEYWMDLFRLEDSILTGWEKTVANFESHTERRSYSKMLLKSAKKVKRKVNSGCIKKIKVVS